MRYTYRFDKDVFGYHTVTLIEPGGKERVIACERLRRQAERVAGSEFSRLRRDGHTVVPE